ncbi:hypothetical protein ACHWQZ_G010508 [Mnemiopsis leidyi]
MTKRELSELYEEERGEGSKNRYLVADHVFSTLPKEMRGSALLKEERSGLQWLTEVIQIASQPTNLQISTPMLPKKRECSMKTVQSIVSLKSNLLTPGEKEEEEKEEESRIGGQ